jgi:NAD-dependent dihydropyrimidine dehydrogenase PreA subunit
MAKEPTSFDIFSMLSTSEEKEKQKPDKTERQKRREEMLSCTKMKDLFAEGTLTVNKHTCVGVQCKLCLKVCPTNALYWKTGEGEVGITEDLCVYCGACVLSCMVDDCIKVLRKRETGENEKFSTTHDAVELADRINSKKRAARVRDIFPSWKEYCERYELKP